MRVLYIDVYALINFSVDLLALYFSVRLLHISSTAWRLVLAAVIGAGYAVGAVFLPAGGQWAYVPLAVVCLCLMAYTASGAISMGRRLRLCVVFLLFQLLLAGCVYYGYQLLDNVIDNSIFVENFEAENRSLLVFAVLVLLSVGVLRLFRALIGESRAESVCRITVELFGHTATADALVDSGNLVRDPMDGRAVILVKASVLRELSLSPERLLAADTGKDALCRRLRLIPCQMGGRSCLLYGVRADHIYLERKQKREEISAVIAWDKEDGTYGGYPALVPSAVLET